MHIHLSPENLIIADDISDYIPVISSVSNAVDLFVKFIYIPSMEKSEVLKSYYWRTLEQKDTSRSLILLLPFIGNCIIMAYDFHNRQYNNKDYILDRLTNSNFGALAKAHPRLQDDAAFMLDAIKITFRAAENASNNLRSDAAFMLDAIKIDFRATHHASENLKSNAAFMLDAIKINFQAAEFANESLKSNAAFMLDAIKITFQAAEHASKSLEDDAKFILDAIKIDPRLIKKASNRLMGNKEFILNVIKTSPTTLLEVVDDHATRDFILSTVLNSTNIELLIKHDFFVKFANIDEKIRISKAIGEFSKTPGDYKEAVQHLLTGTGPSHLCPFSTNSLYKYYIIKNTRCQVAVGNSFKTEINMIAKFYDGKNIYESEEKIAQKDTAMRDPENDGIDLFKQLPKDTFGNIFSNLDSRDLSSLKISSTKFTYLMKQQTLHESDKIFSSLLQHIDNPAKMAYDSLSVYFGKKIKIDQKQTIKKLLSSTTHNETTLFDELNNIILLSKEKESFLKDIIRLLFARRKAANLLKQYLTTNPILNEESPKAYKEKLLRLLIDLNIPLISVKDLVILEDITCVARLYRLNDHYKKWLYFPSEEGKSLLA